MTQRKRGRPPKPPSEALAWVAKVRATMLLGAELEHEAAREGLSVSAYVLALVLEARAARLDRWRKDGDAARVAKAHRAAADATALRLGQSTADHMSASQPKRGTGPGVASAGRAIFAARETRHVEPLPQAVGDLFGPRKSTPAEVGTATAREAQKKTPEAATSGVKPARQ